MLFSVIVPAYKIKYLGECVESVLNQNYKDFELIIIDDNSPENLYDNCVKGYCDERIIYVKNNINIGGYNVVDNWNNGISYAHGEYVVCMGDDDKLLPNCLEDYSIAIKEAPDINVFHTRAQIIDEKSEIIELTVSRAKHESTIDFLWHEAKGRSQFMGDFLFKKSVLEKKGFIKFPWAWGTDRVTVIDVAEDKGIIDTQKFGFQYRSNSISISTDKSNLREKVIAWEQVKAWYNAYLSNIKITAEDDIILKEDLEKILYYHVLTCQKALIRSDIKRDIKKLIYWWNKRCEYDYGKKEMLKDFIG